ncbi:MAG: Trm112 family protein, partial [Caulobacteraceae bacterium]|nr:Trm112 family protein [Caulobacteraceae bacterium]
MSDNQTEGPELDPRLWEILVCPVTHGRLIWDRE